MSLSNEELDRIAREAERDLNTYRAKVGTGSKPGYDECGVNTDIDSRFPGAHVELNTSGRGDKRRIPVEEGGEVDARGRTARASQYEGEGGPTDKVLSARRANPGMDDPDIDFTASPIDEGHEQEAPRPRAASSGAGGGRHVVVHDPLREGEDAARANRRGSTSHPHYKGEDYYVPESVPDSISAEGNIPPDSIIQASRETEGYDRT